jgi:creatinine amidohydrolase
VEHGRTRSGLRITASGYTPGPNHPGPLDNARAPWVDAFMQLGLLTSPAAASLAERVVVLPLGSLEQHGNHLPLLTDTLIGAEVARRAEAELDDFLFLPTLWVGASHHHLHFPGTVSASQNVYIALLEDMVESLIAAGYRKIFLLNAHAGNIVPAQAALTNVQIRRRKEHPDLYLAFSSWFDIARDALSELDDVLQKSVSHACEWETSAIEAIDAALVSTDARVAGRFDFASRYFDPSYAGPSRVFVARTMEQGTTTGAYGWPERSSAEKGERILSVAAAEVIAFLREFEQWPVVVPQPALD